MNISNTLKIGFAGTFYTMWTVETETTAFGVWNRFTYHKNLSIDLDTAVAKFNAAGGVGNDFCDELRGKSRSYQTFTKIEYLPTQFNCGKYSGNLIAECTDLGYLKWYESNESSTVERGLNIMKAICSLDKSYVIVDGQLTTLYNIAINELLADETVVFTACSNLQCYPDWDDNLRASVRVFFEPKTKLQQEMVDNNIYGLKINNLEVEHLLPQRKEFRGNEYWVPKGKRSFKKLEFTIKDNKIILI
jgi:hypothetical protein